MSTAPTPPWRRPTLSRCGRCALVLAVLVAVPIGALSGLIFLSATVEALSRSIGGGDALRGADLATQSDGMLGPGRNALAHVVRPLGWRRSRPLLLLRRYRPGGGGGGGNESRPPPLGAIPRRVLTTAPSWWQAPGLVGAVASFVAQNPSFTAERFDDAEQRSMVAKEPDARILEAFDALVPTAFKSDVWRLVALKRGGGVYHDAKMQCVTSELAALVDGASLVLASDRTSWSNEPRCGPAIYQAFLAAAPAHPFVAYGEYYVSFDRMTEYSTNLMLFTHNDYYCVRGSPRLDRAARAFANAARDGAA